MNDMLAEDRQQGFLQTTIERMAFALTHYSSFQVPCIAHANELANLFWRGTGQPKLFEVPFRVSFVKSGCAGLHRRCRIWSVAVKSIDAIVKP